MDLTIVYITARKEPHLEWFFDSLKSQIKERQPDILIIDLLLPKDSVPESRYPISGLNFHVERPKPCIWQGEHRIMKEDWFAAANARNTGIALCRTSFIAFVDDRCVLVRTWLNAVREAMHYHYAVCGPYEKRENMRVENGVIVDPGKLTGEDDRLKYINAYYKTAGMATPWVADKAWWYGCSTALPLQWALDVNGYPEDYCNGSGFEDSPFGLMLHNNGRSIYYDERMKIIEDRTDCQRMKMRDKGVSPNDKSHAIQNHFLTAKTSGNSYDLRLLRDKVLSGEPFPPPTEPHTDWYDGKPVTEMDDIP